MRNALAAVGVGISLDLDWEAIRAGLESFRGVRRRFEILGEVDGVKVVSDYAHHPTEIRAVLEAARAEWSGRLVAVCQPHLYTRTRDFAKAFGMALSTADSVWVTDIYAAREEPIDKVDGGLVADWVRKSGNGQVNLVPDANALPDRLLNEHESEDLVIVMGAGDIDRVAHELVSRMRAR